jgi:hypothetical protein
MSDPALRQSGISATTPEKIMLTVRYPKKWKNGPGFSGSFATGKRLVKESIQFGIDRLQRFV